MMRADLIVLRGIQVAIAIAAMSLYAGLASLAAAPIRQLTETTSASMRPAWSPDSKRIAFQRNEDGDAYHIYVMDADGGNARRLTDGRIDDRHPVWSPDGRSLAVDSGTEMQREIWVIDASNGARRQVTHLGVTASFPVWSPTGDRIAFYGYRSGAMDLWVIDADGGGAQQLTQGLATEQRQQCTFACHSAAWTPDGRQLAFADGDQAQVLLMAAAAGSGPSAPLTPRDERSHFPIFLRDGRLVYVSEHVTLDQSWTDLWAIRPEESSRRDAVAENVQAQGPFELSSGADELLFASPRSGNFEIYAVTLDEAGKAALAQRPPRARDEAAATARAQVPEVAVRRPTSGSLRGADPYLVGLVAIGLIGLGIELLVRARRARS